MARWPQRVLRAQVIVALINRLVTDLVESTPQRRGLGRRGIGRRRAGNEPGG